MTDFKGYGVAVYSFFRDNEVWQESAISAPGSSGIHFQNSYIRYLAGNGGIKHVVNEEGNGVWNGQYDSYLCDHNSLSAESSTESNLGAIFFLN